MSIIAMITAALFGAAVLYWICTRFHDIGIRDLSEMGDRAASVMAHTPPQFIFGRGSLRRNASRAFSYAAAGGALIAAPQLLKIEARRRVRILIDDAAWRLGEIRMLQRGKQDPRMIEAIETAGNEIAEMRGSLMTAGDDERNELHERAASLLGSINVSYPRLRRLSPLRETMARLLAETEQLCADDAARAGLCLNERRAELEAWNACCATFTNPERLVGIERAIKERIALMEECLAYLKRGQAADASSSPAADDPWQVLGVARGASPNDVKRAYRRRAAQYHPDRVADAVSRFADAEVQQQLREWFSEQMRRVNDAYQTITKGATP